MERKRESKEGRKKVGNESAKKIKTSPNFGLKRMRQSKLLYNLQQKLVQNLV